MPNITKEDAFNRVQAARVGSLVDARDTYLVGLRTALAKWLDLVDAEIAAREVGAK